MTLPQPFETRRPTAYAPPVNTTHLTLETIDEGLRFRVAPINGSGMILDSGKGATGPSPIDATLAALGGCLGMDVIGILRKMRQDVTGYDLEVTGARRDEHPRRFTRIEVVHRLRGRDIRPSAVQEAIRLSEEKYCSVAASLADDIEIASRFEITAEGPAGGTA